MSNKEMTQAEQIRVIEQACGKGNFHPLRDQIRTTYTAMCQPDATDNAARLIRWANLFLDFPSETRQVLKVAEQKIFAEQLRQLCKSKPALYDFTLERIDVFMDKKKPALGQLVEELAVA